LEFVELLKRCMRILHIARKPTPTEYNKVAKVTALGMVLFGVIGLVVSVVFGLIG
jgi:protein transport protein SEC61 subunit gamma and related proteins